MLLDGRKTRAFIDMQKFIPTKSAGQCRSHHQKRIQKNQSLDLTLAKFYRDNYVERLLDYEHLERELKYFAEKAFKDDMIDEEEFSRIC